MKAESFFDTYCGPAPMPQDIWASWNFDPWLVGALVAAYLVHATVLLVLAALIGLSEGQEISWLSRDGKERRLTVLEVRPASACGA